MAHYGEVIDELKEPTRSVSEMIPDTWRGFADLHKHAVADGALRRGQGADGAHDRGGEAVRRLHRLPRQGGRRRALREEVAEALGVALLMTAARPASTARGRERLPRVRLGAARSRCGMSPPSRPPSCGVASAHHSVRSRWWPIPTMRASVSARC